MRSGTGALAAAAAGSLAVACEAAPPGGGVAASSSSSSDGLLALPKGFNQRVLSSSGKIFPGPIYIPGHHDGMTALPYGGGATLLVRNHEQTPFDPIPVQGRNPFDKDEGGGVTGVVVSPELANVREFTISSGTRRNCAGGRTPWDTWLTCEESKYGGHGYVFEVMPDDPENDLSRTPIRAMGRFSHEAVGIDPATGIAYLTEDDPPESFVYRYIPDDRGRRPGALLEGGRLQAMRLEGPGEADGGRAARVGWVDVDPDSPHAGAVAGDAIAFRRIEGAVFADGAFWFPDTSGGPGELGQVWRYTPAQAKLELFFEPADKTEMQKPDNLVMTPWGDLWFVEDGIAFDRLMGITPEGVAYEFARNTTNDSELSGPCFSPDGKVLFINMYDPAFTMAVWGPFEQWNAARRKRMAASEPEALAPKVSDEVMEVAMRRGMGRLEAAACERLGVALA